MASSGTAAKKKCIFWVDLSKGQSEDSHSRRIPGYYSRQ